MLLCSPKHIVLNFLTDIDLLTTSNIIFKDTSNQPINLSCKLQCHAEEERYEAFIAVCIHVSRKPCSNELSNTTKWKQMSRW